MPAVPGASGTFRNPGIAVGAYISPQFKTQYAAPAPAAPIRTARFATPNAFGLGQAKGLAAFSQGLANMGQALERIQLQDEENELKSRDVEAANRIRAELYGDIESGQEGYLATQNNDALDGYVPTRQRLAQLRDEMMQDISSKRVRDRFAVAIGRRLNVAFTEMAQHNNSARNNVSQQVAEARKNNAKNDAANNPAMLPQSLAILGQETVAAMNRSGVTNEEVIANEVEKEQTDAVLQSINMQLSQGNANGAAALLRDYADIITPAARAKASVAVMRNLVVEEAQTLADEVAAQGLRGEEAREFVKEQASNPEIRDNAMARLDALDRRRRLERQDTMQAISEALPGEAQAQFDEIRGLVGDDFAQGIEMAREIEDPRLRDEVVRRLSVEEGRDRARNSPANIAEEVDLTFRLAVEEAGSRDPDAIQGILEEWNENDPERFPINLVNKTMGVVLERERQREALQAANIREARVALSQAVAGGQPLDAAKYANPGYADEIAKSPEALATLQAMETARAKGEIFASVSDGETMHNFRQLAPQDMAEVNLLEQRHLMNPSEFSEASRMQAAVRDHLAKAEDANLRWVVSAVDTALKRYSPSGRDYNTDRASDADRAINNAIYNRTVAEVQDFIAANGREPYPTEIDEIAARNAAAVSIERQGFFSPVTQFLFGDVEVDPSELQGIDIDSVETATVDYATVLPTAQNKIRDYAAAHDSTLFPNGQGITPDVMSAAYASLRIASAEELDKTVRRRAWQRYKRLLGVR